MLQVICLKLMKVQRIRTYMVLAIRQLLEKMYAFYQMLYVGTSSEKGVLDYDIGVDRVYVTDLPRSAELQK